MAKVQDTESSDFDRVPKGEYIAFFAGFVPRDEDTMRPRIIQVDEWKDNVKTGDKSPAILWSFQIIYPEEHRGEEPTGKTPWKALRVVQNEQNENILQVDRVGSWIANIVRWSEICGVDWQADLGSSLPDAGQITDQMIVEALESALLNHARVGVRVVIKIGESGYVDTKDHNSDCVMPLAAGPAAKKVEGIEYKVPDYYGKAAGGMGSVEAGSWSDEDLDAMRVHIRQVLHPALITGETVLTLEEAKDKRWLALAISTGGADYALRAQTFADTIADAGFDAVKTNLLIGLISVVTGHPVKERIVDFLAPPQLEAAVEHLTSLARALGKEVPDPPALSQDSPDEDEGEIPF